MNKISFPCERKKSCAVFLALLLLGLPLIIQAKVIDQIAAVVNDDVITTSELQAETEEQYRAAIQHGDNDILTTMEVIREKTLNSIIDRKLLEQKAKELHVEVTKEEVDKAFAENINRSRASEETFLHEMQKAGFSAKTYRKNLRASLLQRKLIGLDVQSKIVITDEMIERYYQKHYIEKVDSKLYNLLQMGFVWGIDADGRERTKENARELARKIHADVLIGKNFAKLAKKYSDLPSALDGGSIGGFTLSDMAEQMASAVKDLRPSEVSKIVEINDSYQFYQLTSFENNFTVVKDKLENVKKEIQEKLYQEKLRKTYKKWITSLKDNAYIQKLH